MSGTSIWLNGEEYEATPEAMAELRSRGLQYSFSPPGKGDVESNTLRDMAETAGDTLRAGVKGATWGLSEAGDSALPRALGLVDYDEVAARSPTATTIGEIGGSIASPAAKIGMAAKGASTAARLGKAALGSAAEGLVNQAAEGGDLESVLKAGGWSGILGLLGAGAPAAAGALVGGKTAQKGAAALGNLAENTADSARVKAFGMTGRDVKDLAAKSGLSGPAQVRQSAQELEQLVPSPKWGSTAAEKGDALAAIRDARGADIGTSLDEAGRVEGLDAFIKPSTGSPGTWAAIQQKLEQQAAGLPQASPAELARSSAASGFASRLADEASPNTLGDLHRRVSDWGKEAYRGKSPVSTLSDSAAGEAAEMGRSIGRDELGQLIDNYALPDTAKKFRDSMKGYSDVADYTNIAQNRGNVEAANTKALGGGIGVLAPLTTLATTGSVPAAMMAAGMALHSGTRNYLTQLAETSRGYDMAANAARNIQGRMRKAPQYLPQLGQTLAEQGRYAAPVTGAVVPMYVDEDEEARR